ncbi:MAG TPA: energy-coupling factor transporter transmembrane component T [Acidimicrobiales bacterium]|nr:energy-coupling factor transporter transmembrane component T [Acidimicrobiales bacterium]
MSSRHDRVHAGAWWVWALALAAAATRTTNPLLLALIVAVSAHVVVTCRTDAPWARSYGMFLRLGLIVIAIRVVFHVLLGGVTGPTVWFTLPEVPLPDWAAGIRIGGPVSAEGTLNALYDGMRLATILACVGAANSLADPRRLLASLPGALYEVSVAVVVGLTTAPQLVTSTRRIRRAQALRGDAGGGWRRIRSVLVPVLEDAFARSLDLAATMDARGYGRTAGESPATRRLTGALVIGGLGMLALGAYGLLDPTAPSTLRWPPLIAGGIAAIVALRVGSRRAVRSRYRPDQWGRTETAIAVSGLASVVGMALAARWGSGDLVPPFVPLAVPELPVPAAIGVLIGLAPAALPGRTRPRQAPVHTDPSPTTTPRTTNARTTTGQTVPVREPVGTGDGRVPPPAVERVDRSPAPPAPVTGGRAP